MMSAVLIVIGGIYGLSMVLMLGSGLLWGVSRRFRKEMTGEYRQP
jgi:hypothetical protein